MASKSTRILTGLAGLPAEKEPHRALLNVYSKVLRGLQKLPADLKYRIATEEIITSRKSLIESNPNHEDVEKKIGAGLCEEMIQHAKYELELIDVMTKYRPWEPLEEKPPQNQWKWPM